MTSVTRVRRLLLVCALVVVACLGWRGWFVTAAEAGNLPASTVEVRVDDTQFQSDAFIQSHVAKSEWIRFPVRAGMAYRVSQWWSEDAGVSTYLCDANGDEVLAYPGSAGSQPSVRWVRATADGFYYVRQWNPGGSPVGSHYSLGVLEKPFGVVASAIAGTVRNAPEGTPAAGASIKVWPADSCVTGPMAVATAGADGAWSADVLPGSYTVRFDEPRGVRTGEYFDHLTHVGGYPDAPTSVSVPEATSRAGIDGMLALRGTVMGRIVDPAGNGMQGVTVTSRGSVGDGSAMTGSDGSFRIDGIDTGWPHELVVSHVVGWYAASGDVVPYVVAPGATFEPMLTLYPAGRVAGTVVDSAGVALPGIRVACLAPGGTAAISTVTGADGRYAFDDERAGTGTLSFTDPDGIYATLSRGFTISWGKETVVDQSLSAEGSPVATFTIDPRPGVHGSISPAAIRTVVSGESTTFTIAPDPGYHVVSVLVDGSSVGARTSYTFANVDANHILSATFAPTLQSLRLAISADHSSSSHGHAVRFYGTTSPSVRNGTRLSFQIRKSVWVGWTTVSVRSTYSGHHWSYTLSTWKRSHGTYYLRVRYTGADYLPAVSAQRRLTIR